MVICWKLLASVKAISMNGSSEYLLNSTNNPLWVTDIHSMLIFCRPQAIASNWMIFVARNSWSAANIIQIELLSGDGTVRFVIHNSAWTQIKDYRTAAKVANNTKTTLWYTRNAWTLKVRVNWSDVTSWATKTVDSAGNMTATDRRIAMWAEFGAWYCQIDMATVAMWDTELSATEMAAAISAWPAHMFATSSAWDYTSYSNCMHQWNLWKNVSDIGKDYGNAWTLIDVDTNAVNIDSSDIITY